MVKIKSCDVRVLRKVDARAAVHGGVRRGNRRLMEVTMDYDPKNISEVHFDHHSFIQTKEGLSYLRKTFFSGFG